MCLVGEKRSEPAWQTDYYSREEGADCSNIVRTTNYADLTDDVTCVKDVH
jgi:hypothetical protein